MFTAAVQSLDGAKPNTNPTTNPNLAWIPSHTTYNYVRLGIALWAESSPFCRTIIAALFKINISTSACAAPTMITKE